MCLYIPSLSVLLSACFFFFFSRVCYLLGLWESGELDGKLAFEFIHISISFFFSHSHSNFVLLPGKPNVQNQDFFLSPVSILSAYAFPPFCFRVRFFLVSTSVLRDFGATVVYPCHNSQSEGTASPRKRVLHLLSSYSKKKNLLKNGDPFVKCVVTIDHLLWFVLLAASFCCDSCVCVFFSLFSSINSL